MNPKRHLASICFPLFAATTIASFTAKAGSYTAGDLVLYLFQEGGTQTIYANLGPAYTYRGDAAGSQDAVNRLNILNLKPALDEAYGTDWAKLDNLYAGLAAVRSTSTSTTAAAVNGDPGRTIYTSVANNLVDDPGGRIVATNTGMTTISNGIISMNTRFPVDVDFAVVPSADSFIERQNPFFASGILGTAFGGFAGGVAQKGETSSLGKFGSVSNVEFALNVHRILATHGGDGTIDGGLDADANPVPIRTSTYEGTITIDSSGVVGFSVAASLPPPVITVTGSLSGLTTIVGTPSSATSFTVSGSNMKEGITIVAPDGFEVSNASNSGFANSITIGEAGTINNTTIYVRLTAANEGTYSGDIALTSGTTTQTIATATSTVSASSPSIVVSGTLGALSTTFGTASSTTSFTLSGTNMTSPVTVTAPSGFEVSTSINSGFANSITVPASGTLANTIIHVRLSPTANAGTYGGNIGLTSTDATEKTIAIASSMVNRATQTIDSIPNIGNKTFGDPSFVVTSPSSNSGLPVTLSVISGPASISDNNTVTLTGAGTVTIAANQAGNTNYEAAAEKTTSFIVSRATQTIASITSIGDKTYGDAPFPVTLPDASSGLAVTLSVKSGPASISGNNTVTIEGIGTVTIAANQAGNTNYEAATEKTTSFIVSQATPTITTPPSASPILKGQTLTESTISGAASVDGKFDFATPSTQPNATADHLVIFTPFSANYKKIEGLTVSVAVNESDKPVIISPVTANGTFNEPFQYQITATNSPTAFEANNLPPGLSINAGTGLIAGTPTQAGTYDVALTLSNSAGDSESTLKITVNKATASVTLGNLSAIYDGSSKSATATTTPAGLSVSLSYNGSESAPKYAGNYSIVGTVNEANYSGNATGTLVIAQATPSVTDISATAITYGAALSNSTLTGTKSTQGILAFNLPSSTPSVGLSNQSWTFTPDDVNYKIITGTVSVNVNKATPTISTLPTASAITLGSPLSDATIDANNAVANGISGQLSDGKWTLTDATIVPSSAGNYTASITYTPSLENSANYTTATGNISVTVNKATPIITTPPTASTLSLGQKLSDSILIGGNATVSGKFEFTNPNTQPAIGTSAHNVTFTPTDTTNYLTATTSVEVITQGGASPVITNQPADFTAPLGTNATFSVQATGQNLSYQWKRNGVDISSANSNSYTIGSASFANSGDYSVVISSDNGSAPVTSQIAKLIVTFPLADLTINENTSPILSVSVFGTGLKYQWFKDGMPLRGQTNSTLTLKEITVDQVGNYTVEVTDASGNKFISESSKVTVNAVLPEISSQPSNASAYTGGTVTMRVMVKGAGHNYQWKKNGKDISGETKNTLAITDLISEDAGEYSVSVTNSVGTITSRSARLRVITSNTNPNDQATSRPVITSHPVSVTLNDGGSTILSVKSSGGGLLYQWMKNNKNIIGGNQSTYSVRNASADDVGDYTVVVYNSLGSVTSNIAKVAINAPEIEIQQPAGSALTSGASKISFGTARLGKAGIKRTFTIKNIGNLDLKKLSISKAGTHSKEYTITRLSRRTLKSGASITFRVTFKPKALGLRATSLRIASNDRDENPFIINLAGQGAR